MSRSGSRTESVTCLGNVRIGSASSKGRSPLRRARIRPTLIQRYALPLIGRSRHLLACLQRVRTLGGGEAGRGRGGEVGWQGCGGGVRGSGALAIGRACHTCRWRHSRLCSIAAVIGTCAGSSRFGLARLPACVRACRRAGGRPSAGEAQDLARAAVVLVDPANLRACGTSARMLGWEPPMRRDIRSHPDAQSSETTDGGQLSCLRCDVRAPSSRFRGLVRCGQALWGHAVVRQVRGVHHRARARFWVGSQKCHGGSGWRTWRRTCVAGGASRYKTSGGGACAAGQERIPSRNTLARLDGREEGFGRTSR